MSRVLIVDDHEAFRRSATAMLEAGGFTVVGQAHDARSAIDASGTLRPDVVLLDVRLPDEDGFAVADAIGRHSRAPAIVLTSSYEAEVYATRIANSCAVAFIPKHELSVLAIRLALAGHA